MAPLDRAEARAKMLSGQARARRDAHLARQANLMPNMSGYGTGADIRARNPGAYVPSGRGFKMRQRSDQPLQRVDLTLPEQMPRPAPRGGVEWMERAANQGDSWGLSGLVEGPGNFVREKLGGTAMNLIRNVGPLHPGLQLPYQATRLMGGAGEQVREAFGDVVTDPYSYVGVGIGGGAVRAARGLGFAERMLAPTLARGTATSTDFEPTIASLLTQRTVPPPPDVIGGLGGRLPEQADDSLARLMAEESAGLDYPGARNPTWENLFDPADWSAIEGGNVPPEWLNAIAGPVALGGSAGYLRGRRKPQQQQRRLPPNSPLAQMFAR